jgi:DNA modification methylase
MKYDIQPHKEILGMNFYNVDCMELMKQTPDNYYELAIVDPPYGINISLDLHKRGKSCKKKRL